MIEELKLEKILKLYPWLFLAVVLLFLISYSFFAILYPVDIPEPGKSIYIPPGSNLKQTSDNLEKEGIIRSAFYLRAYLILTKQNKNVKAGTYTFKGHLNTIDVAEYLVRGGVGIKITFPEGLTLKEIESLLEEKGIKVDFSKFTLNDFPKSELLKYFPASSSLEGFLAPDTYEFFPEEDEKTIVNKFLKNFEKKFLSFFLKYPEYNFYEKLILASILEKEGKTMDDRKIIAGILEKRLMLDKKLEIDATIGYIKCKKYPCDWNIHALDLKIDSPYNTYLYKGYPPTPIANPGLEAIKAALEPVKSEYLFYLTTKDGQVIFSKTLKEHQQNIKKYLK